MTITVYTFEPEERGGSFTTQDYAEAKQYAADTRTRVIANEFEWADSEPLDDFRPARERRRAKA